MIVTGFYEGIRAWADSQLTRTISIRHATLHTGINAVQYVSETHSLSLVPC